MGHGIWDLVFGFTLQCTDLIIRWELCGNPAKKQPDKFVQSSIVLNIPEILLLACYRFYVMKGLDPETYLEIVDENKEMKKMRHRRCQTMEQTWEKFYDAYKGIPERSRPSKQWIPSPDLSEEGEDDVQDGELDDGDAEDVLEDEPHADQEQDIPVVLEPASPEASTSDVQTEAEFVDTMEVDYVRASEVFDESVQRDPFGRILLPSRVRSAPLSPPSDDGRVSPLPGPASPSTLPTPPRSSPAAPESVTRAPSPTSLSRVTRALSPPPAARAMSPSDRDQAQSGAITGILTSNLPRQSQSLRPSTSRIENNVSPPPASPAMSTADQSLPLPTSRSLIETQKQSNNGRGKAGIYNPSMLRRNRMVKQVSPPEDSSVSVRDHWKKWTEAHKIKIKKDVSRYMRNGTDDIMCMLCRKTITVDRWLRHRTVYNYCKPGDKYLKFSSYKADYPNIDIEN